MDYFYGAIPTTLLMSQSQVRIMHLLVFCYTVRTVLPLFPLGYLDLGIIWRPEAKVWIDDHLVHLRQREDLQTQLKLQLDDKMV